MWDANQDDAGAFERRLDAICSEIGARGMRNVPEAVPPTSRTSEVRPDSVGGSRYTEASEPEAPAPAPARATVSAPAPAPAPVSEQTTTHATHDAVATAPDHADRHNVTPTMQTTMPAVAVTDQLVRNTADGGSLAGVSALVNELMKEQQKLMQKQQTLLLERDAQAKAQARAERLEHEEKFQALQTQMDDLQAGQLRESQMATLQLRLEALHASKLLSDDELYQIEIMIVDSDETEGGQEQMLSLLSLSSKLLANSAFARHLRRKFLQ
jgi:hypothetical protein